MGLQVPYCIYSKKAEKKIYGKLRNELGTNFYELVKQKESKIEKGHLKGNHVFASVFHQNT